MGDGPMLTELVVIPRADHFYNGCHAEFARAMGDWLAGLDLQGARNAGKIKVKHKIEPPGRRGAKGKSK